MLLKCSTSLKTLFSCVNLMLPPIIARSNKAAKLYFVFYFCKVQYMGRPLLDKVWEEYFPNAKR